MGMQENLDGVSLFKFIISILKQIKDTGVLIGNYHSHFVILFNKGYLSIIVLIFPLWSDLLNTRHDLYRRKFSKYLYFF